MPAHSVVTSRTRTRLLTAAVAVALVVGAVLVGRLSAPADPAQQAGPVGTGTGTPSYARNRDGAEAAAAWFVEQIYGARGRGADAVRARFQALVTRPEALDRIVAAATTTPDGELVAEGTTARVAAVGVYPAIYELAAARMAVWSVIVSAPPLVDPPSTSGSPTAGNASAGPTQRWQVDIVSLEWHGGRWQFAATDVVVGPMPPPDQDQQPNSVGTTAELKGTGGALFEAVPDGH